MMASKSYAAYQAYYELSLLSPDEFAQDMSELSDYNLGTIRGITFRLWVAFCFESAGRWLQRNLYDKW